MEVLEPLGNETLVSLALPDGRLVARGSAAMAAEIDAPMWFRVPLESVLYFDRASGLLLK